MIRDQLHGFIQSERKYHFFRALVGAIVSFLVMVFGILQTQFVVALWPRPSYEWIREHIATCNKLQDELRASYRSETGIDPKQGIRFDDTLFSPQQLRLLHEALNSLLGDQELQIALEAHLGVSMRNLDVDVLPSWETLNKNKFEQIGLTGEGVAEVISAGMTFEFSGFTVRDRIGVSQRTRDGNPKVFLNVNAFESIRELRFTLFHQLLHAMNVPGHYPSRFMFLQSDLAYLPEYRFYIQRQDLEGSRPIQVAVLLVAVPGILFLFCLIQALRIKKIFLRLGKEPSDF